VRPFKCCNSERTLLDTHIYMNLFVCFGTLSPSPKFACTFRFTWYMPAGTQLIVMFCIRIEACVNYVNIFMNNSTEQPFLEADSRSAIKIFLPFHGTQKFTTVFERAVHRALLWATWMQSKSLHFFSWWSILILSSKLRLCLFSILFLSEIPTEVFNEFYPFHACYLNHQSYHPWFYYL
jgi:hypothetical protein